MIIFHAEISFAAYLTLYNPEGLLQFLRQAFAFAARHAHPATQEDLEDSGFHD